MKISELYAFILIILAMVLFCSVSNENIGMWTNIFIKVICMAIIGLALWVRDEN